MPSTEAKSPFAPEASGTSPFEAPAPAGSPFAASAAPAPAPPSSPFAFAQSEPPPVPAAPAPQASAPASKPAATPAPAPAETESYESDSRSIRQLELRAIFGVDRELSADEILQRARALPGIRHVARVPAADSGTIEALKRVVAGLGFGAGQVKLYCGSVPIEFIRENNVLLAVQNDGSFAPGVRETLMIVARELGRL